MDYPWPISSHELVWWNVTKPAYLPSFLTWSRSVNNGYARRGMPDVVTEKWCTAVIGQCVDTWLPVLWEQSNHSGHVGARIITLIFFMYVRDREPCLERAAMCNPRLTFNYQNKHHITSAMHLCQVNFIHKIHVTSQLYFMWCPGPSSAQFTIPLAVSFLISLFLM